MKYSTYPVTIEHVFLCIVYCIVFCIGMSPERVVRLCIPTLAILPQFQWHAIVPWGILALPNPQY
jgi:hypothetical protein